MGRVENELVFKYLLDRFNGKRSLNSIFQSFRLCSYDDSNKKYLVESEIQCINFDRLSEWINGKAAKVQSADSMTLSDSFVYLIEFKAGKQIYHTDSRKRLIKSVTGKINDSDGTLFSKTFCDIEGMDVENIKLRFYLVVEIKEDGVYSLASSLASLSRGSANLKGTEGERLINRMLPDLKKGIEKREHFDDVDIWYSELFDEYLTAHKIRNIEENLEI